MNVSCGNIGMLCTLGFIFRTFADLRFFFVDLKRWMAIFLLLGSDGALGRTPTPASDVRAFSTETAAVMCFSAAESALSIGAPSNEGL